MFDGDFAKRLGNAPNAPTVVDELFTRARLISETRLYLSIVDLEVYIHQNQRFYGAGNGRGRSLAVAQFGEYMTQVDVSSEVIENPRLSELILRLHMLAYCQFWECHAVQRLLAQLVRVVNGEPYEPCLSLDSRSQAKTAGVYDSLIARSKKLGLSLSPFLEGTYSSQIRNAFTHSDFYISKENVVFLNYNQNRQEHVPSLRLETWHGLFRTTTAFIHALFGSRVACEEELLRKAPYPVELDEFPRPFDLDRDDRGGWIVR